MTYAEKFTEIMKENFPKGNAVVIANRFIDECCPGNFFGEETNALSCDSIHSCECCWGKEYKEAEE